jgi:hypothetical protein
MHIDDWSCNGDLVCIDMICENFGDEGEPCIPSSENDDWCREDPDNLVCVDGVCENFGEEGEPCIPKADGDSWCIYYSDTCEDGVCR